MRQVFLPEYLRTARARLGITQREVAQRASMSAMTISQFESGAIGRPRNPDSLLALAHAYKVDPKELALAAYGMHYVEDRTAASDDDHPAVESAVPV